jgi:hypothetical protein
MSRSDTAGLFCSAVAWEFRAVTADVQLGLIETRTFGSRVIYERYGRARDESD